MNPMTSNETPRVSIVMPAFNAMATLEFAVESVRAQTLSEWELLIIDDGSWDDTVSLATKFADMDDRIRLMQNEQKGVSGARNAGIRESTAPVIAFLDSDDAWHPDKLESHLRHFENHPDVGVSFSQAAILDAQGRHTGQTSRGKMRGLRPEHLLCSNPSTTTSTLVVRREVFSEAGLFNASMSFAEDLEWLIRASIASGYRLAGLDQPLTLYRTSPDGLSSRLERMQEGWEQLIAQVSTYAPELVAKHYRRARAEHLLYLARRALRLNGQGRRSARLLGAALGADWRLAVRKPVKVAAITLLALAKSARTPNPSRTAALRRS